MSISVIIPIYKVEAYIERCVISLMEQTFQEVEYIFVDDFSPDNSIGVLEKVVARYPNRIAQVQIVRHEKNKGLPAARNTGLAVAQGEYIYHCDSDDYVENDLLEKMYSAAKEKEADYVWCDYYLTFEKNERYMKQPAYSDVREALIGVLSGQMKYNVWNKLVKRKIYTNNNIQFPEGKGMGEDMTMIKLLACAEKVLRVSEPLYHYVRLRTEAFTHEWKDSHLKSLIDNTVSVTEFLRRNVGDSISDYLEYFKLNNKYPFLFSTDKAMFDLWRNTWPEANRYIHTNTTLSFRAKFLQEIALSRQDWILTLHYIFVHKFIYGYIYR